MAGWFAEPNPNMGNFPIRDKTLFTFRLFCLLAKNFAGGRVGFPMFLHSQKPSRDVQYTEELAS
jgi:hypothetical protein